MKRFIIITFFLMSYFIGNTQEESCKTCVIYNTASTSERIGDIYKQFNNSKLQNAMVTILPADLIVLAGKIEITEKMLDDETKKDEKASVALFYKLEKLTVKMLLLNEAKRWAEKNKKKISENDVVQAFIKSLTAKISVNDTEGKAYYNTHLSEYKGIKYIAVAKKIKQALLIQKQATFIENYKSTLVQSTYIEINKNWLEKNIK